MGKTSRAKTVPVATQPVETKAPAAETHIDPAPVIELTPAVLKQVGAHLDRLRESADLSRLPDAWGKYAGAREMLRRLGLDVYHNSRGHIVLPAKC